MKEILVKLSKTQFDVVERFAGNLCVDTSDFVTRLFFYLCLASFLASSDLICEMASFKDLNKF